MVDGAIIFDRAYFFSPEWEGQKSAGFERGAAWLDLLALTNQNATTTHIRGIEIPLERGQCGWSKLGLADRWGRSQNWVSATLVAWEKKGRVRSESNNQITVITVLEYDTWQTALLGSLREQMESKPRANGEQKETEKGEERREVLYQGEKREGRGAAPTASDTPVLPTNEEVESFCAVWPGDLARGIPAGIPEGWWSGWLAMKLLDEKKFPRDWQRVLVLAFRADFLNRHPKAIASLKTGTTATGGNGVALSANVQAIQTQTRQRELAAQIADLENEVFQDRAGNLPRDPEKTAILKKLRAELGVT
jgi:hypothetical protein